MKISASILTATAVIILMHLSSGECKRIAPAEVKPVIHNSIRYTAPHWGIAEGHEQNGGLVQAWDIKIGKMLWEIQVYKTEYNNKLERDVQDVFIASLTIKDGKLIVLNKRNEEYEVDLTTKKVTKIQDKKKSD